MNHEITIMELFAGIGGFSKGFEDAGFNITDHYFSEIDKHAIANYKYNFPNAKYIGDVKSIQSGDFTKIDIITFGSPCQDFSLAGKRKGLEGDRSSLIEYAIRIISDLRPSVFIWENVKGAFSSNAGADFWAILQAFANIGAYRLEWQLLNTKWFLPQNRERIYLVGHLTGRSKPGVFPISEDNCGITKGPIETPIFRTLTAGGNSGGLHSSMTLIQSFGRNDKQKLTIKEDAKNANCLTSRMGKDFKENIIVGTWRDFKGEVGVREMNENVSPTLLARARADGSGQPVVSYAMGSGKKGRSCINSQRIPEIGNEQHSIRRLTEIECERLQGFPDDWTKYGVYEKQVWTNKKEGSFKVIQDLQEIPKTQRYKMLGNAVTVKVVEEIAKRLKQTL